MSVVMYSQQIMGQYIQFYHQYFLHYLSQHTNKDCNICEPVSHNLNNTIK